MSKKIGTAETTRILEEAGCENHHSPAGQDGDGTRYWNCSDKDLSEVDLSGADLTGTIGHP
jgi:uncharacterized protein YjbI with pentapeptide repeats